MTQEQSSDRRRFMKVAAGAAASLVSGSSLTGRLLGQTPPAKPPVTPPAKPAAPSIRLGNYKAREELNPLFALHSQNGKLDVNLTCMYSDHWLPEAGSNHMVPVHLRTYNGGLVGPVISVRLGDTLNIRLVNNLPPDGTACPDMNHAQMNNAPVGVNTTNLHTHGFHVSPSGNSDDVFVQVCPQGGCFEYSYQIPQNQPVGTMWYHPHKHGSAAVQVANGMAGALIVRGAIDDFYASNSIAENILLFQQIPFSKKTVDGQTVYTSEWKDVNGGATPLTIINGQVKPIIKLDAGKVYVWRLIHGGINETIPFSIIPVNGSKPQPCFRVAVDGITTGSVDQISAVRLAPGERNDVLVKLAAGTYNLLKPSVPRAQGLNTKTPETAQILAEIVVAPGTENQPIPTAAQMAPFVPPLPAFTGTPPQRHIEFGYGVPPSPGHWNFCTADSSQPGGRFCESYNPDDPVLVVLGDSEQWQVVNTDSYLAHPFHIHVNAFKVVNVDYDQSWLNYYANPNNKEYNPVAKLPIDPLEFVWRDTILIHPCQRVTFNTKFEDYDGCFVMHCHILKHEDQGMMKKVEILPSKGAAPNCGPVPAGCASMK